MKSLTQSSGSQTPLFSPFSWWSHMLPWRCSSLDPWSSLSGEGEGCLGGLLNPEFTQGCRQRQRSRKGRVLGAAGSISESSGLDPSVRP